MALTSCNISVDKSGLELQAHGTRAFPVACYQDDLTLREVPWHWHDELEIIFIDEGQARILAGTQTYLAGPGEAVFTNAGVFHADFPEGEAVCKCHSVVFHPALVGGSYDSVFWQDYVRPLTENKALESIHLKRTVPWQARVMEVCERAWQACVQEMPGYPIYVRSALSEGLLLIWQNQSLSIRPSDDKQQRDSRRVKEMVSFLVAAYGDPLTLEQIAASASVSKSECLRCFRAVLRTTPIQYLRDYRLQQAADRLRTSDQKVSEIARQCGFLEMSYFSKVFRQKFGCSPLAYRGERGWEEE